MLQIQINQDLYKSNAAWNNKNTTSRENGLSSDNCCDSNKEKENSDITKSDIVLKI